MQETRNKLTDYWREHEIREDQEFAILTNIIHQEWTGVSVKDHRLAKGLTSHNLCDHMAEAELIFTALAEFSTRQIAENIDATGMGENTTGCEKRFESNAEEIVWNCLAARGLAYLRLVVTAA